MQFQRYAVYYAPRPSALARAMAVWLGWDPEIGAAPGGPAMPDMPLVGPEVTETPRKYGFHGTIKAPFRLAHGVSPADLTAAVAALAARLPPVVLPGMDLAALGGFLALVPQGKEDALRQLAAEVTQALEPLRAPLTEAELARRQPEQLTDRQRQLLQVWGYPYVLEEFRFHLTLTGNRDQARRDDLGQALRPWLAGLVPRPFPVEDLCLFGEAPDGRFHLISRHALTG